MAGLLPSDYRRRIRVLRGTLIGDSNNAGQPRLDDGEFGFQRALDGTNIELWIGTPTGTNVKVGMDFNSEEFRNVIIQNMENIINEGNIESIAEAIRYIGPGLIHVFDPDSPDPNNPIRGIQLAIPSNIEQDSGNDVFTAESIHGSSHTHRLGDRAVDNRRLNYMPGDTIKVRRDTTGEPQDMTWQAFRDWIGITELMGNQIDTDNILTNFTDKIFGRSTRPVWTITPGSNGQRRLSFIDGFDAMFPFLDSGVHHIEFGQLLSGVRLQPGNLSTIEFTRFNESNFTINLIPAIGSAITEGFAGWDGPNIRTSLHEQAGNAPTQIRAEIISRPEDIGNILTATSSSPSWSTIFSVLPAGGPNTILSRNTANNGLRWDSIEELLLDRLPSGNPLTFLRRNSDNSGFEWVAMDSGGGGLTNLPASTPLQFLISDSDNDPTWTTGGASLQLPFRNNTNDGITWTTGGNPLSILHRNGMGTALAWTGTGQGFFILRRNSTNMSLEWVSVSDAIIGGIIGTAWETDTSNKFLHINDDGTDLELVDVRLNIVHI